REPALHISTIDRIDTAASNMRDQLPRIDEVGMPRPRLERVERTIAIRQIAIDQCPEGPIERDFTRASVRQPHQHLGLQPLALLVEQGGLISERREVDS